jgi:hypothetical protein
MFVTTNGKQINLSVQYIIGKFVKPNVPGTQLMIFDTLQSVKEYLNITGYGYGCQKWTEKIFLVEAKNVRRYGICVELLEDISERISKLLKLKKNKKRYLSHPINSGYRPSGTLFAEKVKLVKEINL